MQHNEFAVGSLVSCTAWLLSTFISYRLLHNHSSFAARHSIITFFASATAGTVVSCLVGRFNQQHMTHEADRFAAHTLKCHQCLEEVIAAHEYWSAEERKGRYRLTGMYLPISELRTIAQELKDKNCLCTYHREHASAEAV